MKTYSAGEENGRSRIGRHTLDCERGAFDLLHRVAVLLHDALEQYLASPPGPSQGGSTGLAARMQFSSRYPKDVEEIVGDLLCAKRADGLSNRYIETVRSHLHRFSDAFRCDIASIRVSDIDAWLRSKNVGPRARNNMRGSIVTLFHFAQKQGYLPKGQPTEADDIAKAKDRGGKIGILKPGELALLLANAPEKICLFLALGAFTGIRSSEILRLEWRDVNFDRRFIAVAPEKAKTATRRLVPILPNLLQWLHHCGSGRGLLFRTRRDASRMIEFAKSSNVHWPNNALRHSYATYRLAAIGDAARVALEMGNSPAKLITNYRELADATDAEAWFSVWPR